MSNPESTAMFPRSKEYYLEDSLIVFLVDGELYRVHRRMLTQESSVFCDMFSVPQPPPAPETIVEGTDDDHAITLSGTSKQEFDAFLGYISRDMRSPYMAPLETSLMLVQVADRYECENIHKEAVALASSNLRALPFIDRVNCSRKYDVDEWEIQAYRDIIIRDESVSTEAVKQIGSWLGLVLAHVKYRFMKSGAKSKSQQEQEETVESYIKEELVKLGWS